MFYFLNLPKRSILQNLIFFYSSFDISLGIEGKKEDSRKPEKMWGRSGESFLHLEHSERGGIRGLEETNSFWIYVMLLLNLPLKLKLLIFFLPWNKWLFVLLFSWKISYSFPKYILRLEIGITLHSTWKSMFLIFISSWLFSFVACFSVSFQLNYVVKHTISYKKYNILLSL